MKISCAQITQVWDNADEAFARADEFLAGTDADMVLFSEQYATGWRCASANAAAADIRRRWIELAVNHKKYIIGSYHRPGAGKPYNTMLVCAPDGKVLAEYDKMHLFAPGGENEVFTGGEMPVTFEYEGIRFGCSICFDLRFPEVYRTYLQEKCHVMLVQAAWPVARTADWELLLRARALENRCYTVGCNCLGYDEGTETDYAGRSMICDPEGRVIEDAGVFEGGCAAWVDKETVEEWRGKWGL